MQGSKLIEGFLALYFALLLAVFVIHWIYSQLTFISSIRSFPEFLQISQQSCGKKGK